MKISNFFSKTFLFFGLIKESINMEDLYQIIGHVNKEYLNVNPSNTDNHPYIPEKFCSKLANDPIPDEDAYVRFVKEKIRKKRLEKHIIVSKNSPFLITETGSYYYTKYKITIKNLVIRTRFSVPAREMIFDQMPPSSDSNDPFDSGQQGVHLVFENNHFIGINRYAMANFYPKERAYLVFKNNKFKSGGLFIETKNSFKIEVMGNKFTDGLININCKSGPLNFNDVHQPNVVCIESNVFYRNDDTPSKLIFNGEKDTKCYFKGKNTVDNLIISTNGYLHWGGHQNINPQGKRIHAHTHKQMFIDLMKHVIQKNDKVQEARLHRELLKCERIIIREEDFWLSLQDKFILGWSSWISDYGISWLRPFSWLIIMNLFFASIVFYSFECQSSWGLLFAEFFNPLSSLADVTMIEKNGWISFTNILQKAFLALFLYEMIKIFRRFSK